MTKVDGTEKERPKMAQSTEARGSIEKKESLPVSIKPARAISVLPHGELHLGSYGWFGRNPGTAP